MEVALFGEGAIRIIAGIASDLLLVEVRVREVLTCRTWWLHSA